MSKRLDPKIFGDENYLGDQENIEINSKNEAVSEWNIEKSGKTSLRDLIWEAKASKEMSTFTTAMEQRDYTNLATADIIQDNEELNRKVAAMEQRFNQYIESKELLELSLKRSLSEQQKTIQQIQTVVHELKNDLLRKQMLNTSLQKAVVESRNEIEKLKKKS